jgi:hypothetical protein
MTLFAMNVNINFTTQERKMAKARIDAGICGHYAEVQTEADSSYQVKVKIESSCKHIQKLAENLSEVNALNEISARRGMPEILSKGLEYCTHTSCPVPVGIIKTVEVAAGLALPQTATIVVEK